MSVSTFTDGDSTVRETPQSTARYTPESTPRYTPESTPRYTPESTSRTVGSSVAERISASALNTPREEGYNICRSNNEIETYHHENRGGAMIYNRIMDAELHRSEPSNGGTLARASTSSQKDLNAANNMLPQTFESRRPPKLELRTMQNSYQNSIYNVNKTPVNEVLPTFKTQISKNQAEDYIKKVNMAACVIQTAFRKMVRRRKALRASEAAMKRLLSQKREDFTQKQEQLTQSSVRNKELVRQQAREEKAKQARKVAIEVVSIIHVILTLWTFCAHNLVYGLACSKPEHFTLCNVCIVYA